MYYIIVTVKFQISFFWLPSCLKSRKSRDLAFPRILLPCYFFRICFVGRRRGGDRESLHSRSCCSHEHCNPCLTLPLPTVTLLSVGCCSSCCQPVSCQTLNHTLTTLPSATCLLWDQLFSFFGLQKTYFASYDWFFW